MGGVAISRGAAAIEPSRVPIRCEDGGLTVAKGVRGQGRIDVLILVDEAGRIEESVAAVVDRLGAELGSATFLVTLRHGARRSRVKDAAARLLELAHGSPLGARIVIGRRDESVAVEACEGSYRLVVDMHDDPEVRRTLKMCSIPYVVGPAGVARFADAVRNPRRFLTRRLDGDAVAFAV